MKGNLTRRGRNSWRLKFEAGADPASGARVTKYQTLRGTRREAQEQAAKIIAEHAAAFMSTRPSRRSRILPRIGKRTGRRKTLAPKPWNAIRN